jgi:hypothetical protein
VVKHRPFLYLLTLVLAIKPLLFLYRVGGSFYSTFRFWLSTIKSKDKSDKLFPFTVAPQGP